MWKWLNCYLSGRHNFGISCEPGEIFLRCSHCGKRTPGWAVDPRWQRRSTQAARPNATPAPQAAVKPRTLPISSVAAS